MRLFLAIDLPDQIKSALSKQVFDLQKEYAVFNWVATPNYHMTVHFFGETQKLQEINDKTKSVLFEQQPFYLYSTHLDLFMTQNITIYANFRREKLLEHLTVNLRDMFSNEFQEVKEFKPHVTVARCKIPSKQQYFHLQKKISRINIDLEFKVTEISLFESITAAKKPVYRKIATFPFAQ